MSFVVASKNISHYCVVEIQLIACRHRLRHSQHGDAVVMRKTTLSVVVLLAVCYIGAYIPPMCFVCCQILWKNVVTIPSFLLRVVISPLNFFSGNTFNKSYGITYVQNYLFYLGDCIN